MDRRGGALPFGQECFCLALTSARTERGTRRTDQGYGVQRTFQHRDIAQQLRQPADKPRVAAVTMIAKCQQHKREIGPWRLRVDPLRQPASIDTEQCFLRDDRRSARLQLERTHQRRQVRADRDADTRLLQHLGDDRGVTPGRREHQDAIACRGRAYRCARGGRIIGRRHVHAADWT